MTTLGISREPIRPHFRARTPIIPDFSLEELNAPERIKRALSVCEWMFVSELSATIDVDTTKLHKILRRLEERGVVESRKQGDKLNSPVAYRIAGGRRSGE